MGSMLNFAGVYNIVWTLYIYIYIYIAHATCFKGQLIGYDSLLKITSMRMLLKRQKRIMATGCHNRAGTLEGIRYFYHCLDLSR